MNETNTDQMNLEGNRPSNAKFALINGIYMGVALIIFSLVLYLLDVPRESPIQYLSYVITIALTIVFVIQWRDKHNDGFLTYGQAFSHGILIILFASILSAIYTFIFFQIIAPGEIENMLKEARESMYDNPAINDDNIDMAMSMTEMFMKPWVMSLVVVFFGGLGGLLISAILSIFLKKEDKAF